MSEFPWNPLSGPITKLIETVSSGLGVLYEPTRIVLKAKTDAKTIKIIDKASIEALANQVFNSFAT
jgi:formate-dependent nitrite reductase membrane component NrfD